MGTGRCEGIGVGLIPGQGTKIPTCSMVLPHVFSFFLSFFFFKAKLVAKLWLPPTVAV